MRRIPLLILLLVSASCNRDPLRISNGMQTDRECFWASQVSGFSSTGRDRALVRIGTRERWELTLAPGCPDIDWAMQIGIRARGGSRICSGRNAELLVPNASGSGMQRCLVRDIRQLPPEKKDREETSRQ